MPKSAKVSNCKFEVGELVEVKEHPKARIEAIEQDEQFWDGWRVSLTLHGRKRELSPRFLRKVKPEVL